MKPTIEQRLRKLEAARAAHLPPIDYRAAYGVDRSKFALAMQLILAARTHMVRVYHDDARLGMRLDWKPEPYEPQPPAEWTEQERAAWPCLVELYDALDAKI